MKTRTEVDFSAPRSTSDRLFPDEWLLQFENAYERIHAVAKTYLDLAKKDDALKPTHHIEAAMLGKQFVYGEGLPLKNGFPHFRAGGITPQARGYVMEMHEWLREYSAVRLEQEAAEQAEALDEHFRALLERGLGYELTERQLIELRGAVNELQAKVSASAELSEHRRERLLTRLEKVQRDLHKKISSLDRLYGTAMEVLALAQKLDDEAKPLVDVAGRIFGSVWAIQSHKDGAGIVQTIVPFPLPPPDSSTVPLPVPLPFSVGYSRSLRSGGPGSIQDAAMPARQFKP